MYNGKTWIIAGTRYVTLADACRHENISYNKVYHYCQRMGMREDCPWVRTPDDAHPRMHYIAFDELPKLKEWHDSILTAQIDKVARIQKIEEEANKRRQLQLKQWEKLKKSST